MSFKEWILENCLEKYPFEWRVVTDLMSMTWLVWVYYICIYTYECEMSHHGHEKAFGDAGEWLVYCSLWRLSGADVGYSISVWGLWHDIWAYNSLWYPWYTAQPPLVRIWWQDFLHLFWDVVCLCVVWGQVWGWLYVIYAFIIFVYMYMSVNWPIMAMRRAFVVT